MYVSSTKLLNKKFGTGKPVLKLVSKLYFGPHQSNVTSILHAAQIKS